MARQISFFLLTFVLLATWAACSEPPVNQSDPGTPEADTTLAGRYFARGDSLSEAAQYDSALVYYEKASVIYEAEEDWEKYVQCYNGMGNSASRKGSYDQAREYLAKALELGRNQLGIEHPHVATSYNSMGNIDADFGNYDQALEYYWQALSIKKAVFGEMHPDAAASYYNIGIVHWEKGEYDEAIAFFEQTLSIRENVFGAVHSSVASSLNGIGNIYREKGDQNRALEYFERALTTWRNTLGDEHPNVAIAYNNMGMVYWDKSDYDQALYFFQKALSIRIAAFGEQHPSVAASYNNLGGAYAYKGDYEQALAFLKQAMAIRRDVLGESHPLLAVSYSRSGLIYSDKGDHDEALAFLKRALSIRIAAFGEQHPSVAASYNNLGTAYANKGDYDQALEFFKRALSIRQAGLGTTHISVAESHINIGAVYNLQGNYAFALRQFQEALLVNSINFHSSTPYENPPLGDSFDDELFLTSLQQKAHALTMRHAIQSNQLTDLKAAHATNHLATQLIDKMRVEYKAEGSKLTLSAREVVVALFNQAIATAQNLNRLTGNPAYLHDAFTFAEQRKAAILRDAFNETQAKRFTGIPDSLLEQDRQLRADLAFYTQQLIQEQLKRDQADSARVSFWQGTTFDLNQRYDTLLTRFENEYPDYYRLKYSAETASVEHVQERILADTTALLEYFLGADSLYTFVVTRDTLAVHAALREPALSADIDTLYALLSDWDGSRNVSPNFVQAARGLYQTLLEPIEGHLQGKTHLIVVPDSNLSYVPFETLLTDDVAHDTEGMQHSDLPYLVKRHAVSYTYSATLLLDLLEQAQRRKQPRRDFIAFAPVEFAGDDSTAQEDTRRQGFLQAYRRRGLFDEGPLPALPYSEAEVQGVLQLFDEGYGLLDRLGAFFTGSRAKVLMRADASETRLKQLPLDQYRFVHFATHAGANADNGLLSAIVLPVESTKAASDSTAGEDGLLYLSEVYALSLNAEMVVLSACETGLGEILTGEGVIGLTRGFLYAGSSSVLVSQWSVGDEDTAKLMVAMYTGLLNGMPRVAALRQAKLSLIAENAPPWSWSAFVLVGVGV